MTHFIAAVAVPASIDFAVTRSTRTVKRMRDEGITIQVKGEEQA